ncbi:MAG: polysaccharide biosynthesis protein [Armatimonadetes bacterium]|nr:polysaccharide biosynthesis protein [Armatimonadota bacterium]
MRAREKIALALADFLLLGIGVVIALGLRVDFDPATMERYIDGQFWLFPSIATFGVCFFYLFGLYDKVWRYAGTRELLEVVAGVTVVLSPFQVLVLLGRGFYFPRTGLLLAWFVCILLCGGVRVLLRLASERGGRPQAVRRVLIVGANDAGETVLRDLSRGSGSRVVGFVDDDPSRRRLSIRGTPVLGSLTELPELVREHSITELILAQLPPPQARKVVDVCSGVNVHLRTVPAVSELAEGRIQVEKMRPLSIEDLLERDPVKLDLAKVASFLKGRRVLVTGAGGSIGSEICRQVVRFGPESLILLGRGENSIYEIGLELRGHPVTSYISDVRDRTRMEHLFQTQRPQVVFHAAAHKHVPMMETNAAEAVSNNVFGTMLLMELCRRHQVERFVLLSTDKAVAPTSMMGATKRLGEMLLAHQKLPGFAAVRFGNVLGSRGSVVPTFRRQIERGGPVTVTDPEMTRFFMTIPEAVSLVIQAASMARGGEIYVLDMGKPVRIYDLARNLIRLSGYEPDHDIAIEIVGTRPGEKMHEELISIGEETEDTDTRKIMRVLSPPPPEGWPGETMRRLEKAVEDCDDRRCFGFMEQLVPGFHTISPAPVEA